MCRSSVFLLCVVVLLPCGRGQDSCGGQDGTHGASGLAGRDGWPGVKGEKGEPVPVAKAELLDAAKGEAGSRGFPGSMGPKGYRGDLGPEGGAGARGLSGPVRGSHESAEPAGQNQVAFSVVRTASSYPSYTQKVTFQSAHVNHPGHFNTSTGIFTCGLAGVYYFVFHSMSKVTMCLRLRSEIVGENLLGFCDYNSKGKGQVLSGGAVLQLAQGQTVWLQAFRDSQPDVTTSDAQEKQITFNGFLLFPTS